MKRLAFCVVLSVTAVANAAPQGPRDPNWPCQQIKVPEMSLAAVWSGPGVDPQHSRWKDDQQVVELVQKLTLRREPLDRARDSIRSFAQLAGDQKLPRLMSLLTGIYTTLDAERNSILAGLDRFGSRQKQIAEAIRSDNANLQALQSTPAPDPATIQQMTERVKWAVEISEDRRQAIGYACEAPSKIEQRMFSLARLIQEALE